MLMLNKPSFFVKFDFPLMDSIDKSDLELAIVTSLCNLGFIVDHDSLIGEIGLRSNYRENAPYGDDTIEFLAEYLENYIWNYVVPHTEMPEHAALNSINLSAEHIELGFDLIR